MNGSILVLLLINHLASAGTVRFLVEPDDSQQENFQNDQELSPLLSQQQTNPQQQSDKNEILKRIEESNSYHAKINEIEFDYFNMLSSRKKKDWPAKSDKGQLIRPPYMYANYQQLTNDQNASIDDQIVGGQIDNTDQSAANRLNSQFDSPFTGGEPSSNNGFGHELSGDQSGAQTSDDKFDSRTGDDRTVQADKLDNPEPSINSTAASDQPGVDETDKRKSNWLISMLNKFGLKSNENLNATLNTTAIKEKLSYYSDYDVMMGIRIGYWLFSFFSIFTAFIAYKSYCSSRKQARHRRESEKNRRKADEQGSSRRGTQLPAKYSSVRGGSSRQSNFVKLKSREDPDSSS